MVSKLLWVIGGGFFSFAFLQYGPPSIRNGVSTVLVPGAISSSLKKLDPAFAKKVKTLIERLDKKGHSVRIQTTYRSKKRQDLLYDITQFGKRLGVRQMYTKARGGESCHNRESNGEPSSYAVDLWGYPFGPEIHISDSLVKKHADFFKVMGKEAVALGLGWGGNFSRYDEAGNPKSIWTRYKIGWDPPHVYDSRCKTP